MCTYTLMRGIEMAPSPKKTNKLLVVIVSSVENENATNQTVLGIDFVCICYHNRRERKVVASKYSQFKHRRNTLISRRKGTEILLTRVRITCNI